MEDVLLKITDVAEILATSPKIAREILAKAELYPINFGRGRSKGHRWLKSAVMGMIQAMYQDANKKPVAKSKRIVPEVDLTSISSSDLFILTQTRSVQ